MTDDSNESNRFEWGNYLLNRMLAILFVLLCFFPLFTSSTVFCPPLLSSFSSGVGSYLYLPPSSQSNPSTPPPSPLPYSVGSSYQSICFSGFRLNSSFSSIRICGEDGRWSGEEPTCVLDFQPFNASLPTAGTSFSSALFSHSLYVSLSDNDTTTLVWFDEATFNSSESNLIGLGNYVLNGEQRVFHQPRVQLLNWF